MIDMYSYKIGGESWVRMTQEHLEEYTGEVARAVAEGDLPSIGKIISVKDAGESKKFWKNWITSLFKYGGNDAPRT